MIYINNVPIENATFPDKTAFIRFNPSTACKEDKSVKITWLYDNDSELFRIICLTKHLKSHGFKHINLIMPYVPNARMDRVKSWEDVFTLKYFADIINDLEFEKVTVFDPHSNVCTALINNIEVQMPQDTTLNTILHHYVDIQHLMLFFPDEGAMKRYSDLAKRYDLPYCFGIKRRDWRTGNIEGLDIAGPTNTITGKTILIIDDICSKGGTFYHSAKALKEYNAADIDLYVSHCENTIHNGKLLKSDLIRHIYTTNSIYRNTDIPDKMTIVPINIY